ncbi:MAG: hypothetical protein IJW62_03740 [Clostridia bacterium]|nr:hypothetical protein [Clostridia bacterium]
MKEEFIQHIRKIRETIQTSKEGYNACVSAFESYRDFLEKRLAENPSDVDAVCQLATVYLELRYDSEAYYDLYRQFLLANEATLTDEQKARIYNNLTALCDQDWLRTGVVKYAQLAISCGSRNACVYDAYGRVLWENDPNAEHEWCFERANELKQSLSLAFNLAVARYRKGKLAEANERLTALLREYPDNDQVLYAKALCLIGLSVDDHRAEIHSIAEKLDQMPKDEFPDIDEVDIATLYFLCGQHGDYRRVVDRAEIRYANDAYWLAPYFYSMKARGEEEELASFYRAVMEEEDDEIADSQDDPDEKDFRIACKQSIVTAYEQVQEGILPSIEPRLYYMWFGCYLDDCPRHGKLAGESIE